MQSIDLLLNLSKRMLSFFGVKGGEGLSFGFTWYLEEIQTFWIKNFCSELIELKSNSYV